MNERIREINAAFGEEDGNHEILLCECGRPGCSERLEVPADVYEVVRSEAHRFLVAPGHEEVGAEQILAGAPTYLVIAMRPEPS